jgi:hypothetical protein
MSHLRHKLAGRLERGAGFKESFSRCLDLVWIGAGIA